jgi:hypothetical protein
VAENDLLMVTGSEHVGHVVSLPVVGALLWAAYACARRIGPR